MHSSSDRSKMWRGMRLKMVQEGEGEVEVREEEREEMMEETEELTSEGVRPGCCQEMRVS